MNGTKINDFDFDEMSRIAKDDPAAFEQRRQELLSAAIDNASPNIKRRLEGLQWQVDQVRNTSNTPLASCIRISKMMWDSVLEQDGLLDNLERLQNGELSVNSAKKTTAAILRLPGKDAADD